MAQPWPGGEHDPGGGGAAGWGVPYGGGAPTREKGATRALTLGILSFICLPIVFGPAAIYEGVKAKKAIEQSNGALTGRELAIAGIVLGALGLVVGSAWIIYTFSSGS